MFQTKTQHISGFTLVELSIVMAIIGILIGGVLKGREMMINGKITATVVQIHAVEAAVTTFRDTYNQIPGDMLNAAARIPHCTALCNPDIATASNGVLGGTDSALLNNSMTATLPLPGGEANETTLFWAHLALTGLLGGITDSVIRGENVAEWGKTHPATKIGGGFFAGILADRP
ncbi:MAG: prepilin-type N-terminal cleavage/methylation domain-containing protein [Pseudomonadota bacterium]|nr:MAG: prepilin-type N-terminal cleavage/methylation domain-containing protein [Pseudomonadota bacterium]